MRVELDGGVGGDSRGLAGLLMSLTVQLPCSDFTLHHLSVTWRDRTSHFTWTHVAPPAGSSLIWSDVPEKHITGRNHSLTYPRQHLKLGGKVLTGSTPGGVKVQNPVVLAGQN